ncbi:P-loop NTPase [Galbitalea sp. SE-J8]|uniref:Mrp/NBP35 family ATP-binding protein n=1 Tax=Galbitalea sp. SE-J8 TaxID=3054952 RepID=UPI00259CC233|nr:P-loop NTPase [Galbitalea sp. SE-J8]MDM4764232.1 P-loop NTPase [Galbitalea sp. SE-J8]
MTLPPPARLAADIRTALAGVLDPEIRRPITELDMVAGIETDAAGAATIDLRLTIVGCPASVRIERDVRAAASAVPGVTDVVIELGVMTPAERNALVTRLRAGRPRESQFGPESLTRVYAVTSGKGGVGKSSLTANLAVALAARGLAVGLIDADVHGFSIPGLLGVAGSRPTRVGELILPPVAHDVKVISIGMFAASATGDEAPSVVAWRGPMLHRTVQQFLTDVFFGDLDVLLIDMPPGTGDVAISVGQLLPQAEYLVVTTPQASAAEVAERSGRLALQTGHAVVGVVENMAGLVQPDGTVIDVFGSGGGRAVAGRLDAPLLASVPLSLALRAGGDAGDPVVLTDPADPGAAAILALADRLAVRPRGLAGRSLGVSPT